MKREKVKLTPYTQENAESFQFTEYSAPPPPDMPPPQPQPVWPAPMPVPPPVSYPAPLPPPFYPMPLPPYAMPGPPPFYPMPLPPYAMPGPEPAPRRKGMPLWAIILVVVLVYLALQGGEIVSLLYANQRITSLTTTTRHISATASAQAYVTPTTVEDTPTVQNDAVATLTTQAPQKIYDTLTQGRPLYTNSLDKVSDPLWPRADDQYGTCGFRDHAYHVLAKQQDNTYASYPTLSQYHNQVLQVQLTILSGSYGGLMFHTSDTSGYVFIVNTQGEYMLYRYLRGGNPDATIISFNRSAFVNKGSNNLIAVITLNDHIYLYANKRYITQVTDASYPQGYIGLTAINNPHVTNTDVAFNNIQLWTLS